MELASRLVRTSLTITGVALSGRTEPQLDLEISKTQIVDKRSGDTIENSAGQDPPIPTTDVGRCSSAVHHHHPTVG
jgi:hypothetical protein